MYSIHNEGKSVVAESFIRTLRNKFCQYRKYVFIDKLDDIMGKKSNKYHRTIKMKPVDVKPSIYVDFNKKKKKMIRKVLNLNLVIMVEY